MMAAWFACRFHHLPNHDALDAVDRAKKSKDISEDDAKRIEKQIDDALNKARTDAESAAKAKEQEIMTV
jgi:ribosome recycling factor